MEDYSDIPNDDVADTMEFMLKIVYLIEEGGYSADSVMSGISLLFVKMADNMNEERFLGYWKQIYQDNKAGRI